MKRTRSPASTPTGKASGKSLRDESSSFRETRTGKDPTGMRTRSVKCSALSSAVGSHLTSAAPTTASRTSNRGATAFAGTGLRNLL
jgi:hypothetical protein